MTGQPRYLFLNPDGMESRKTSLPKFYIKTKLCDKAKLIEQRLMGVDVVCGPLRCTLCFICDNMAFGGQDLMIEIYRLTFFYLQKLLKYFWNYELPKVSGVFLLRVLFTFYFFVFFIYLFSQVLFLQLDNCGENKNRSLFAYYR
jgi:hypothetical protein